MEAFFDRETKRLEFTAERTVLRANEKKALDSAQIEREKVGHKVPQFDFHPSYDHSFFYCACILNVALILPLVCMKLNVAFLVVYDIVRENLVSSDLVIQTVNLVLPMEAAIWN